MKVLHLDTGNEWRGGQQQLLHLTQGLEERGVISVVATPQGSPLTRRLRDQDLPVIELPPAHFFSPRMVRALQAILADRTWQALHAHTAHAHTLGFLAFRLPAKRPFHRPAFITSRRVDFVPARDPLTRLKYTSEGQTFLCVSEAIRKILLAYGVPAAALRVVHDGVPLPGASDPSDPLPSEIDPAGRDQERRDLRQELGVPEDALLVGNIAQFVEHKGHQYLLDALPSLREGVSRVHVVLLGSGALEKDLRRQAERLGLTDIVTFAGFLTDAARYLPAMDLYVHPSVEEGLGSSILDAQAAGVAVVATTAGGIPEAVEDGVTGVLVPPGDSGALATALLTLLKGREERSRMGRTGRSWVKAHFSTARMVEETLAVYQDVLGQS